MAFKLIVHPSPTTEDFAGADRTNPAPGDEFLLIDRPLIDPKTSKQVGRLIARLTFIETASGDPLVLGNADHHLKRGVISVQGSWRFSEHKPVFAIIGGTRKYRRARGTITFESINPSTEQFTYRVR